MTSGGCAICIRNKLEYLDMEELTEILLYSTVFRNSEILLYSEILMQPLTERGCIVILTDLTIAMNNGQNFVS